MYVFTIQNSNVNKGYGMFAYESTLRDGSRAAAPSKMECFLIIVNGFQPLTIITKHSILDVAAALDLPLTLRYNFLFDKRCCIIMFAINVFKTQSSI